MGIQLPGGRGPLEGKNAESLYGEQLRSRQKESPDFTGLYFGHIGDTGQNISHVANTVYLLHLGQVTSPMVAKWVSFHCRSNAANAVMGFALYHFDRKAQELAIVGGTASSGSLATVARVDVKLDKGVRLLSGVDYWLGWYINDVLAGPRTYGTLRGSWSVPGSAAFPSRVLEGDLTAATPWVPQILYLSEEGKRFI